MAGGSATWQTAALLSARCGAVGSTPEMAVAGGNLGVSFHRCSSHELTAEMTKSATSPSATPP
jgi:hypothetical protein